MRLGCATLDEKKRGWKGKWEGEERDREEEKIIFQKVNTWTSELNRSSTLAYSSRRDNQRRKDQLRNTVYVNSTANRAECNVN